LLCVRPLPQAGNCGGSGCGSISDSGIGIALLPRRVQPLLSLCGAGGIDRGLDDALLQLPLDALQLPQVLRCLRLTNIRLLLANLLRSAPYLPDAPPPPAAAGAAASWCVLH